MKNRRKRINTLKRWYFNWVVKKKLKAIYAYEERIEKHDARREMYHAAKQEGADAD